MILSPSRSCLPRRRPARWLLCFFAVLVGWFGAPAAVSATGTSRTIVFFGDSLTAGYGLDDPGTESYPALIQKKLDAVHQNWRAVNAGLSGETTSGGLRRVDWILRQPVDIFVLALGGNDGLRGIDPNLTEKNLESIVAHVRAKYPSAKIVITGMQMPPAMGADYTERYRKIFPEAAENTRATLVPFLLEGIAGRPDLNQADGIHPTAAGAAVVADNVWKYLRPLL